MFNKLPHILLYLHKNSPPPGPLHKEGEAQGEQRYNDFGKNEIL